ncbi:MAG TPA: FHA domain-containing protein, partial [Chloroflexi bacterium]|nr:FHA domain-containing protein [Chloroflexota bacterium]
MTQETQYQLVVRKGPTVGQAIVLDLPVMTIGRDPISDVVLNDPEVSRQHVRLTLTEDGYSAQDLGSTNGTFIDGDRIGGEPVTLQPGQKLSLGSGVTMIYEQVGAADESSKMTMVGDLDAPPDEPAYTPPPPPPPAPEPVYTPPPPPESAYTPPPPPPAPAYTAPEAPEKKSNTA